MVTFPKYTPCLSSRQWRGTKGQHLPSEQSSGVEWPVQVLLYKPPMALGVLALIPFLCCFLPGEYYACVCVIV